MERLISVLAWAGFILVFLITRILLWAMCEPEPGYKHMGFDEEVKWLMEQGLTKEEAEEIANLPWK
jgi:hypothetical protein